MTCVQQVEGTAHCRDDLYCFYLRRLRVMTYLRYTGQQPLASQSVFTRLFQFLFCGRNIALAAGLEVRRYASVWYTGTSLVGLKSYRHLFLADCHTGVRLVS